jgi:PAS domain S-box-containing protein
MAAQQSMVLGWGNRWPRWGSQILAACITFAAVLLVLALWREPGALQDPSVILLLSVAASTYLAGGMAGMVSAAVVLFCSFFLYAYPNGGLSAAALDWRQATFIMVTCPLIALMVGSLRDQVDQLHKVTAEAEQLRSEVRRTEALKNSNSLWEQRFNAFADGVPECASFMLSIDGTVVQWNAGAERLLGYRDKEVAGQGYSRFFTKEDILARKPERLLDVTRFAGRAEEQGESVRRGGGRFHSRISINVLRSASGDVFGYIALIRDLTDANSQRR